jgi:predicted nucleic acid-binding protein
VSYLLDTNVVSEIRKPQANENVRAWFAATGADELYLSVLTIGEIRRGIEHLRRRDAVQAGIFEAWLATLRRDFAERVLPITGDIADEWGRLGVPDPIRTVDGLLAATARVANLTLVTRNTADLVHTGVRLLDPFERTG